MIINRRTFPVKLGKMDEVVAVLTTGGDVVPNTPPFRILVPSVGTFDRVTLELEFESLAHYETWWDAWGESPDSDEVMERFHACVDPGGVNEIWEIAEVLA